MNAQVILGGVITMVAVLGCLGLDRSNGAGNGICSWDNNGREWSLDCSGVGGGMGIDEQIAFGGFWGKAKE